MPDGLLWFDDRKDTSFAEKLRPALLFYQKKYGRKPDRCTVHPTAFCGEVMVNELDGLRIEVSRYILPHHFLLEKDH